MLSSNMAMKVVYGLKIFVDHTLKAKMLLTLFRQPSSTSIVLLTKHHKFKVLICLFNRFERAFVESLEAGIGFHEYGAKIRQFQNLRYLKFFSP